MTEYSVYLISFTLLFHHEPLHHIVAWEGSGIKPETMHPIEQWETLVAEIILSRGVDHCRNKVVGDLRQDETKIEADVAGPEVNLVHIALSDGCISDLTRNCPYVAPEDILVYSIDEVFIDVTDYLHTYGVTAHDLTMTMIRDVLYNTGITATAGIGTNLYLAKVAMDIVAKKAHPDKDGVRIAELDEMRYRQLLWSHRPLTDFWRMRDMIARKLPAEHARTLRCARLKKTASQLIFHAAVCALGIVMIYPLLWMIFSSFKPTNTIFTTAGELWPREWTLDNYVTGWKGFGKVHFGRFFLNSAWISVAATVGALISSSVVAYGFARLRFLCRKPLFAAMLATMMLPAQVLMIPQYLWYQKLGWVGTYMPLIVPFFFATQGFFVYLMQNFICGIPRELDEAAKIDGCSYYGIFTRVILPLMVPALITSGIFPFIWLWDDFLSALLYVDKTEMYPVSLALKLFCDPTTSSDYGAMFAMSVLSILPVILIFIFLQKYLVEGIATSGLKG